MTAKVVCAAVMIVLLFGIAPPASADFTVVFPDGSEGICVCLCRHLKSINNILSINQYDLYN